MLFDWDDLRHFLAVAETGSLSAAAKDLGTSQPTVGRRLDALETRLGAKLFARTAQGMALTETGTAVLDHARRVRDETAAIARAADKRDGRPSGIVRVSTIESTGEWVTRGLGAFRERYPGIEVELVIEDQVADLSAREADIAIRLFRPQQNSLIARRLSTVLYSFYAAEGFLARYGRPRTVADMANFDFVGWYEAQTAPYKRETSRAQLPAPETTVVRTNSATTMIGAVREGVGIGRLPIVLAEGVEGLVRLFPDLVCAELDIWLVAHADLRTTARIRALWDHIVEQTEDYKRDLPGLV
ncbi:MAG: LysR family transcriptional regulator [Rhodothalassiaceae bacterium]